MASISERNALLVFTLLLAVIVCGFVFGFEAWTNTRQGIDAIYQNGGRPYGFQVYLSTATCLTIAMLLVLGMTELVRKRAMLAAKWEMLYVFVLFAIWLGGGIYTVLDPSPFTDPSLPGENIDRCIDADERVGMWCGIYEAMIRMCFIISAILLFWLGVLWFSARTHPYWTGVDMSDEGTAMQGELSARSSVLEKRSTNKAEVGEP